MAEEELLPTVVEDIALLHCEYMSSSLYTLRLCTHHLLYWRHFGRNGFLPTYVLSMNTCTGLGVRVVLVLGARQQIDELLQKQGEAPQYAAGYRVTDSVAMQTAVQAAGASRMAVEAQLSKVHSLCL